MAVPQSFCPRCGAPWIRGARFCGRCGLDVTVGTLSPPTPPTPSPPPPFHWAQPQQDGGLGHAVQQGFGWGCGCLLVGVAIVVLILLALFQH